jgi:hypothetical protein
MLERRDAAASAAAAAAAAAVAPLASFILLKRLLVFNISVSDSLACAAPAVVLVLTACSRSAAAAVAGSWLKMLAVAPAAEERLRGLLGTASPTAAAGCCSTCR